MAPGFDFTNQQRLRIVCAGSSGGGKTTLTRLLANELMRPPIMFSRPTAAANDIGYERANQVPSDDIWLLQWLGLFKQFEAESIIGDGTGFVADRGTMDFAAYYLFQRPNAKPSDDYVKLAAWHAARKYDLIVLVPPNSKGTEDDGKRHLHGVIEVHDILVRLIHTFELGPKVILLKTDTPEERLQEVLEALAILYPT